MSNESKHTLLDPAGNIIDVRWGGLPALTAMRNRLNRTNPGHRVLIQFGSDPIRVAL